LGGEKPHREFTFDRFQVAPGNQLAFERCTHFNPAAANLYLWGSCGVGKTHLAYATARRCFEETLSVIIQPAAQISRKVRMKDPAQEQAAIDQFADVDVLVLDDLGIGTFGARQE
jgi:DNA replication protein DnaC